MHSVRCEHLDPKHIHLYRSPRRRGRVADIIVIEKFRCAGFARGNSGVKGRAEI